MNDIKDSSIEKHLPQPGEKVKNKSTSIKTKTPSTKKQEDLQAEQNKKQQEAAKQAQQKKQEILNSLANSRKRTRSG